MALVLLGVLKIIFQLQATVVLAAHLCSWQVISGHTFVAGVEWHSLRRIQTACPVLNVCLVCTPCCMVSTNWC
jgi:hypothetical protein